MNRTEITLLMLMVGMIMKMTALKCADKDDLELVKELLLQVKHQYG